VLTTEFLTTGGADVEGEYIYLNYLPFLDKKEQKANKMLGQLRGVPPARQGDGSGAYAWPAAEAFREAIGRHRQEGWCQRHHPDSRSSAR